MTRSEGKRQTGETGVRRLLAGTPGWVAYLLIFLPGVLSIAYVREFGVSVVFRDQ